MLDINGRLKSLSSDAYLALGKLMQEIENSEDVPPEITIEGEELMEGFQSFMETLREA